MPHLHAPHPPVLTLPSPPQVFRPAAPFGGVLLAASVVAPPPASVFFAMLTFLACMSQQFHAWSHMKKSELHPAVVALQVSGAGRGGRRKQEAAAWHTRLGPVVL